MRPQSAVNGRGVFSPPPPFDYFEIAFVKAWDKQWGGDPDGAAVSQAMETWIAHLAEKNPNKDTTNLRDMARCAISRYEELGATGFAFAHELRAIFKRLGFV